MAIIYHTPFPELPELKVPKLHRVFYSETWFSWEMQDWCEKNCQAKFYTSPGWCDPAFIEFEDDLDATLFALRWS